MPRMKNLVILGSTGSIGTQALDVAQQAGYRILALSANRQTAAMEEQIRRFRPAYAAMFDERAAADLRVRVADLPVTVLAGIEGLCALAALDGADTVLNAVVGMVGLRPTMAAIAAGHDVALANKETLVAGGAFVMDAVRRQRVRLLPVDSEHSAIFQSMPAELLGHLLGQPQEAPPTARGVSRLILTASGGPFFGRSKDELRAVTKADALHHPNWQMGQKITIDSATMMNKGLELIEARWLFDVPPERIDILVHRESIVHSLVEFDDRAVVAQLGVPDMRVPIQYALTYPARLPSPVDRLRLEDWGRLTFFAPDDEVFPAMGLARRALTQGGAYPAALNAANEVAVDAFLREEIGFADIVPLAGQALDLPLPVPGSVQDVLATDGEVRRLTEEACARLRR